MCRCKSRSASISSRGRRWSPRPGGHNKVVQVGTQRRSTPHLIDARDRVIRAGLLGQCRHVEIYCYYHMRARARTRPTPMPPDNLNYEMWTGPAPMRPYNSLVHPRSWRAFMEYGNGIVGDMCIHMLDMVRWMLDLGWPRRVSSTGGILVDRNSRANITDTQTATFDFGDRAGRLARTAPGASPPTPIIPGAPRSTATAARSKLSVHRYDFTPTGTGRAHPPRRRHGTRPIPRRPRRSSDLERHVAPAIRGHMRDFLEAIRTRGRPVADIEEGHISTASCILANLSHAAGPHADLGRRAPARRQRRRGEPAAAPALSAAVGASGGVTLPVPTRNRRGNLHNPSTDAILRFSSSVVRPEKLFGSAVGGVKRKENKSCRRAAIWRNSPDCAFCCLATDALTSAQFTSHLRPASTISLRKPSTTLITAVMSGPFAPLLSSAFCKCLPSVSYSALVMPMPLCTSFMLLP